MSRIFISRIFSVPQCCRAATAEARCNSGSNGRYAGGKCVSTSACTMPPADRYISPNCRPTLSPDGAIDVAARLTWTRHDTRLCRAPATTSTAELPPRSSWRVNGWAD